jgi:cytochrome P450
MHAEITGLTLQLVGQTLLGADLSAAGPRIRAGLEAALAAFAGHQVMLPGLPRPGGARTRRGREPGRDSPGTATAQAALHQLVDDICDERRTSPSGDRGDVISALLAASAGNGGLTAGEVHDHVVTLLMAGHETTANALSWAPEGCP